MRQVTAVIAEDETVLRDELRLALEKLWPELKVIGEATSGIEALGMEAGGGSTVCCWLKREPSQDEGFGRSWASASGAASLTLGGA